MNGKSPIDASHSSMVTAATTMNAEEAVPYIWEERPPPPEQVLKMWYEVGNKLDKESTGEHRRAVVTRCCAKEFIIARFWKLCVLCLVSANGIFPSFSRPPETHPVQQLPWISTLLFPCSDGKDVATVVEANPIQDILLNYFTPHLITTLQ